MRYLSLITILVLVAIAPLSASDQGGIAERIAAQALQEQAEGHPQSQHVQALAQGLRAGSITLAEAEQVMRILSFAQGKASAPHPRAQAKAIPQPPTPQPRQDPRDVLSLLDEAPQGDESEDPTAVSGPGQLPAAEEASIADLEAWAGTRSPNLPEAEDAPQPPADDDRLPMPASEADGRLSTDDLPADAGTDGDTDAGAVAQADSEAADGPAAAVPSLVEASPSLPSDQANLEPINGLVRMVEQRESGERTMTMVILDQGEQHGLENGHRLRVERNGQALVLLSVFDVRDRISVAVVLDGSWKVDSEDRQIQIGDGVVRDD